MRLGLITFILIWPVRARVQRRGAREVGKGFGVVVAGLLLSHYRIVTVTIIPSVGRLISTFVTVHGACLVAPISSTAALTSCCSVFIVSSINH